MALQNRIASVDSIAELEAASMSRQLEAAQLGEPLSYWSVYTYGYVVEMRLKAAFFRLCGLSQYEDVRSFLRMATPWAAAIGSQRAFANNLHDLLGWAHLLVAERAFSQRPYPAVFSVELVNRVKTVADHWRETMRYHPAIDASAEAAAVESSVTWILQNYTYMWS